MAERTSKHFQKWRKLKCKLAHRDMNGQSERILHIVVIATIQAVHSRDCYNYKEEPRVRSCEYGCCGDDYEEYCCDATLQIVGCVLGGIVLISIIVAVAFFCYRQKTKQRLSPQAGNGGGLLARFGMRSNHTGQQNQQRIPVIPPRGAQRIPGGGGHLANAQYNPQYVHSVQMAGPPPPGYLYPGGNNMYNRPPIAPTAPMPPPYAMTGPAPPPYTINKPIPPPPEYSTVANLGYKPGNYSMPPPSS